MCAMIKSVPWVGARGSIIVKRTENKTLKKRQSEGSSRLTCQTMKIFDSMYHPEVSL